MARHKQGYYDVLVVGAGASGCMAAIAAADFGAKVLVLEHKEKIGKKILATGNGKCNYTNADMSLEHYHGNIEMVQRVFEQFSPADTVRFFKEIGIYPKNKNGYFYPHSQTASSVQSALEMEMQRQRVEVITSVNIRDIAYRDYTYCVDTDQGQFEAGRMIFAVGLLASPKHGSDGSAFSMIQKFGHEFLPVLPALCGFSAKGMNFKEAAGIRTEARLSLYCDGQFVAEDTGELQLTDYGVSGIPVFQLSSMASRALANRQQVIVSIDFCPDIYEKELYSELYQRFTNDARSIESRMNGLFNPKLIPIFLKKCGIDRGQQAAFLRQMKFDKLMDAIKAYPIELTAHKGFEHAQVCTGGLRDDGVDPFTLASLYQPGLYFAGELLNVDGICGGYNLQWAWSSGYVAGKHAAQP